MSTPSSPVLIGGFNPASEATATASINTTLGTITSITVPNDASGSGYTTAPTVVLSGGGFTTAATATAALVPVPPPAWSSGSTSPAARATPTPHRLDRACPRPAVTSPPTSTAIQHPDQVGLLQDRRDLHDRGPGHRRGGEVGTVQLLNFVLDTHAPVAPAPALDPVSETGTFNNETSPNDNNSTIAPVAPAPVFRRRHDNQPGSAGRHRAVVPTLVTHGTPIFRADGTARRRSASSGTGYRVHDHRRCSATRACPRS